MADVSAGTSHSISISGPAAQLPVTNLVQFRAPDDSALKMAQSVFADTSKSVTSVINNSDATTQQANVQMQGDIQKQTDAEVAVTAAIAGRAGQVASAATQAASAFGADATDSSSIVGQKIARQSELDNALTQGKYEIADLKGQSIFTNPIGWLMAQAKLPMKVAQYNAGIDEYNNNNADIETRTRDAANATNIAVNQIPTTTADMARADADKTIAIGNVAKDNAVIAGARSNSAYAMDRLSIGSNTLSNAEQEAQRQLQLTKLSLDSINDNIKWNGTQDERNMMRETWADKIREKQLTEVSVKAAAEKLGYHTENEQAVFANNFKRANKETQDAILHVSSGQFGTSPYEAWKNIKNLGNIQGIAPNAQANFQNLSSIYTQVTNDPKFKQEITGKPQKEAEAILDSQMSSAYISQFGAPGGTNINHIGFELSPAKYGQVAATAPLPTELRLPANHPAMQAVKTFMDNPNIQPTTNDVVQSISALVSKKGGGIGDAAKAISDYYRSNSAVTKYNMDANSFGAGLNLPNNYVAILQVPGTLFGSGNTQVDLTDSVAVQRYLLQNAVGTAGGSVLGDYGTATDIRNASKPAPAVTAPTKLLGATRP